MRFCLKSNNCFSNCKLLQLLLMPGLLALLLSITVSIRQIPACGTMENSSCRQHINSGIPPEYSCRCCFQPQRFWPAAANEEPAERNADIFSGMTAAWLLIRDGIFFDTLFPSTSFIRNFCRKSITERAGPCGNSIFSSVSNFRQTRYYVTHIQEINIC